MNCFSSHKVWVRMIRQAEHSQKDALCLEVAPVGAQGQIIRRIVLVLGRSRTLCSDTTRSSKKCCKYSRSSSGKRSQRCATFNLQVPPLLDRRRVTLFIIVFFFSLIRFIRWELLWAMAFFDIFLSISMFFDAKVVVFSKEMLSVFYWNSFKSVMC